MSDGVSIDIVEFTSSDGSKIAFQLLTTIKINNDTYYLITPFDKDEAAGKKPILIGSPANVSVMKEVAIDDQKRLEPVADTILAQQIFNLFKESNHDKYIFN